MAIEAMLPRARPYGHAPARRGTVTLSGLALADDGGPWHPLGITFFCGLSLYQQDRARLRAELADLAGTFDFVHPLGVVGHRGDPDTDSWSDRTADPRDPTYDADLREFTDLCYDEFGLRVQWSLFGEVNEAVPDLDAQRRVVDKFLAMSRGREQKILLHEIANEGYDNGYGNEALRDLSAYMQARTPVLVAPSTPNPGLEGDPEALYAGLGARIGTWHVPRDRGDGGDRDPLWKPWEWVSQFVSVPRTFLNNEPPGYRSTGMEIGDSEWPVYLAAYAVNQLCGGAGYVWHNSIGLRLGGQWDQRRGMPKRLRDTPHWEEICEGFRTMRDALPPGLQNWRRENGHWAGNPLQVVRRDDFDDGGLFKAVAAFDDTRIAYAALWVRRSVEVRATRGMRLREIGPSGAVRSLDLHAGQTFSLDPSRPDPVFVGELA